MANVRRRERPQSAHPAHAPRAALAVGGKWVFQAKSPSGGPAVVFTPAEPGRSYERAFGVADGWVDDGHADKGDLLVREDVALLRLSAE